MIKHCDNCNRDFDTLETRCPACGDSLRKADDPTGDIAALMLLLWLLLVVVFLCQPPVFPCIFL